MGHADDAVDAGEQSTQPSRGFLSTAAVPSSSNPQAPDSQTSEGSSNEVAEDANASLAQDDLTSSLLPSSSSPPTNQWRSFFIPDASYPAFRETIRKMGDYLAYTTLITMLILVPIVAYNALSNRNVERAAYNSAWIMVIGTIIMSLRLVYLHLTHWYMPQVQKYVVRILWMVPLYATQSYLSLRFHEARIYIDTVRDLYEAYVISSFLYYLMELLGGEAALVQILSSKDDRLGHHGFPLNLLLENWELGTEFMLQCKHGVLQYVVFKAISTLMIFVFETADIYGEGRFEWFCMYPYMVVFQNVSVMYALYCLVMLYSAVNAELRHPVNWQPLGKFLCVKGVVFLTWWQGVVIYYLREQGIIDHMGGLSSKDVANELIDYCIVIEMVGFAIAHSYTFTYKEYLPSNIPTVESERTGTGGDAEAQDADENGDDSEEGPRRNYRPPATLPQPMNFREAFWESTVPKETLHDIQQMRNNGGATWTGIRPRSATSLQDMKADEEEANPPEQTFV